MTDFDALDLLLDQWAQDHRLPQRDSDEIRRAITAPSVPSPAWWMSFTTQMADVVVRASVLPTPNTYGAAAFTR